MHTVLSGETRTSLSLALYIHISPDLLLITRGLLRGVEHITRSNEREIEGGVGGGDPERKAHYPFGGAADE